MKKAIIIHGWEGTPKKDWLPYIGDNLRKKGCTVEIPDMPGGRHPKFSEWMKKLVSLSPDKHTVLIGHSLANALILKYLEQADTKIRAAVMVAAWDWLMEDVREYHETFFASGFDYKKIKEKTFPRFVINSTNDSWIDFEKSKNTAQRIGATFISIKNAGHFTQEDGYGEFPQLLEVVENIKDLK